jgi:hypothetical protein
MLTLVIECNCSIHLISTIYPSVCLQAFNFSQMRSMSWSRSKIRPLSRDLYTTSLRRSSTFSECNFTSFYIVVPMRSIILLKISKKCLHLKIDSLQTLMMLKIASQAASCTFWSLSLKLLITRGRMLSRRSTWLFK